MSDRIYLTCSPNIQYHRVWYLLIPLFFLPVGVFTGGKNVIYLINSWSSSTIILKGTPQIISNIQHYRSNSLFHETINLLVVHQSCQTSWDIHHHCDKFAEPTPNTRSNHPLTSEHQNTLEDSKQPCLDFIRIESSILTNGLEVKLQYGTEDSKQNILAMSPSPNLNFRTKIRISRFKSSGENFKAFYKLIQDHFDQLFSHL